MTEKLNQHIIESILKIKEDGKLYHRESQNLELKESFNLAGLADYYRDFAAFANNKGGYLIFGVKDRPKRELIGLTQKSFEQFDRLDPEVVTGHLNDFFTSNIIWVHEVFEINGLNFAAFYVYEANMKPIICKKDEGKDQILKNGDIYFRYGGRTQKIQHGELEAIINRRIEQNNKQWMDLVQKIGRSGPQNAAILDIEKGLIEKSENQILVVDEELVNNIQWIKEGEFSEKKGEKTLKLVGSVVPMDQIEVVKKVKENQLKEYPLSAQQLQNAVKLRLPSVKQNEIYRIVAENDIKNNKEYSTYVFRNKKQEDEYKVNKTMPKGIPSIYKPSVIDLIVRIYKNENE
jgi:hypothetical protein